MRQLALARRHMVESQLRPNGVGDEALLAAMGEVPRERFLPRTLEGVAYVDVDLPVAEGRWLAEPRVAARLIEAARVGPGDLVLVLAAGAGYEAALLARLAGTVVAVEPDAALRARAGDLLQALGIANVVLVDGDPRQGHPRQAPYDAIVFTGAVTAVPQAVLDQLAPGGRLVAVVRPGRGPGQATLCLRDGGTVTPRVLFDAATPLLPQFASAPEFVF